MWTFLLIVVYLAVFCAWSSMWGWAVNKVIENKGYRENWFWWGFFFGMIALLVALTKSNLPRTADDTNDKFSYGDNVLGENYVFRGFGHEKERAKTALSDWKCQRCGKVNAGYVGTCGCGWDKSGNAPGMSSEQAQQSDTQAWQARSQQPNAQTEQSQQPQMLYCTSCGKEMAADSRFCRFCGAKAET